MDKPIVMRVKGEDVKIILKPAEGDGYRVITEDDCVRLTLDFGENLELFDQFCQYSQTYDIFAFDTMICLSSWARTRNVLYTLEAKNILGRLMRFALSCYKHCERNGASSNIMPKKWDDSEDKKQ